MRNFLSFLRMCNEYIKKKDKYSQYLKDFGSSIDIYLREIGHHIRSDNLQILDVITNPKVAIQYFDYGQIAKKEYRIPLTKIIKNKDQIRKYAFESDNKWIHKNILKALDNLEESAQLGNQLPSTDDQTTFCNGPVSHYGHRWSICHDSLICLLECPKTELKLPNGTYCLVQSITGIDSYIMIFDCVIMKVKNSKVVFLSNN